MAPAQVTHAVTESAFMLDTLSAGAGHVVRVFRDPTDSSVDVQWNGAQLAIYASPNAGPTSLIYYLGREGSGLSVGTFQNADVNGCYGSLTVNSLDPAVAYGTPSTITSVSATFNATCNGESTIGELRYRTADTFSALGLTTGPGIPIGMGIAANATFVGERSPTSSIVLRNLGTTTLQVGSPAFQPSTDRWTLSANTCSGSLAPNATCSLGGRALAWIPGGYQDTLRLPVSTNRGYAQIDVSSRFQAATFVPIDPVRLVDTRTGLGVNSSLKSGAARTFTVVNRAPGTPAVNIPAGAVAVAGNLTVYKPSAAGTAAITTVATNNPGIRTLRVPRGDTRSNAGLFRLSSAGTVGLTWIGAAGSTAHATFDATGYFIPTPAPSSVRGGNFRPWAPTRVINTKQGLGIASRLRAGVPRTFDVPLVGSDRQSTAVVGIVTVLNPAQAGFLYIGPAPIAAPTPSMLNFRKGIARSTGTVVRLSQPSNQSSPKQLSFTYVGAAGTYVDIQFDIHGTFGSGSAGYVPLVPNRILDSASGKGMAGKLPARTRRSIVVDNRVPADPSRNVPADDNQNTLFKVGLTGNLWMMRPSAKGTLTALPRGASTPPATLTIRSPAGDRRASSVVLGTAGEGAGLLLWYEAPVGATTDVMFDVTGYFISP